MAYISMKDLCKKYNFSYHRLWKWIRKGWVKADYRVSDIEWQTGRGGRRWNVKDKRYIWFVDEESFLKIPPFIRNFKKRKPKKNEN